MKGVGHLVGRTSFRQFRFIYDTRTPAPRPRPAFTLIELLVVLGIIILMIGIAVAVLTNIAGTSEDKRTELVVQKVKSELDKHHKSVIDRANEAAIPPGIMFWAGNDPERARIMMRFLYLRNELPSSYLEAMTPVKFPFFASDQGNSWIGTSAKPFNPIMVYQDTLLKQTGGMGQPYPQDPIAGSLNFRLPTQTFYQQPIIAAMAQGKINLTSGQKNSESSAMLLMILLKPKKGTGGPFNPEETMGSGALKDTDGDGISELVDAIGTPLGYWRFPIGNPEMLTSPNVFDPRGKLVDPAWNNNRSLLNVMQVYLFEDITGLQIHDQDPPRNKAQPPTIPGTWVPSMTFDGQGNPQALTGFNTSRYSTMPVVAAAGRDKVWGVQWGTMQSDGTTASDDNVSSNRQH